MDIHRLKVFLSVFRHRSFSRAADELRLAQPTVSEHVRALERELGCSLFERLGRKTVPTREADVLQQHALDLIERAEAVRGALGRLRQEVSGELVVGASTIPGTYLLPELMAAFRQQHRAVSFQVLVADSQEIVHQVASHRLLLGIVGSRIPATTVVYAPFLEDELIIVAAPSFLRKDRLKPQDLCAYPLLLREEGSGTRREAEKLLEQQGVSCGSVNVAGIFGSTDAIKQAAKAGLGLTILSRYAVAEELRHRTLKKIDFTAPPLKRMFYIATHKKRTLPLVYSLFIDQLRAYAAAR